MLERLGLRRLCATGLVVVAGGLGLAACGSDDEGSSGSSASDSGTSLKTNATESATGFGFTTKSLSAKAGKVTITMDNPSGNKAPHDIAIDGNGVDVKGEVVKPGAGTSTVSTDLKAGTYKFYCSVGQHRKNGMEGTLTVS